MPDKPNTVHLSLYGVDAERAYRLLEFEKIIDPDSTQKVSDMVNRCIEHIYNHHTQALRVFVTRNSGIFTPPPLTTEVDTDDD